MTTTITAGPAPSMFRRQCAWVLCHPGAFVWQVLKAFRANQGMLLAGAVAYYALLSIVPLTILLVIVLSQWVDQQQLFATLGRYLEWLVPGQSRAIVAELDHFLAHRDVMGWVLLVTMVFFSSLAFTVLENAMSVIFHHRVAIRRRHAVISALIPYAYIMCLGVGMLMVTVVAGALQQVHGLTLLWHGWRLSFDGLQGAMFYLLGLGGEVLVIASVYLVMPVGRRSLRHVLVGALTAAVLWEVSRHLLVWYFATLSQIGTVYGSLTTAIAVLLSLEVGGMLLLLGAQVIAEFERVSPDGPAPQVIGFSTARAAAEAACPG